MTAPKSVLAVAARDGVRVEASVTGLDPLSSFGEALARRVAELLLEAHAPATKPSPKYSADASGDAMLTTEQAYTALGVGRSTLNDIVRRREIPVTRVGRALRIRQSDLDAYIRARTAPARGPR